MKLAVIGASTGQLPLCLKAAEAGHEIFCFAWEQGAVCRDYVDHFYPVSVTEYDRIAEICRREGVQGVVSNASDLLAECVAEVAQRLSLPGNSPQSIALIRHKEDARRMVSGAVEGLADVQWTDYCPGMSLPFPRCVVKPVTGAGKKGVAYIDSHQAFVAWQQSEAEPGVDYVVEEYVPGHEVSVETLSVNGTHYIVQITDKENSGAPHFVELAHHQPSQVAVGQVRSRLDRIVPALLTRLGFTSGAAHIEMKITDSAEIYLIEVNPRGGGDEISSTLVSLSTGIDYLGCMIAVALGGFTPDMLSPSRQAFAGIYYRCSQVAWRDAFFRGAISQPWLVRNTMGTGPLSAATGNYDRDGYIIYVNSEKVICSEN